MALNADTLLDRIHLKNQARRWRWGALAIAVIAVLVVAESVTSLGGNLGQDHVARFTLDTVIVDDLKRHTLLQEIAEDDSIKALIVRIDSPGGTTVASEELYLDLLDVAANKPVVATLRSYATSGGYMAALGADHILAREGTLTGSVGVILQTAEFTEMAENLGIKPITVRSGELKGSPTPLSKLTPKEDKMLKTIVNDFYDFFMSLVKDRRKLTDEQVTQIADGRVLSARQAIALNMVDGLGGEKEALLWLKEKHEINPDLDIIEKEVPSDKKGLEKLLDDYASSIFPSNMLVKLDGLAAIWQPSHSY